MAESSTRPPADRIFNMLEVDVANRQRKYPIDAAWTIELARFTLQAEGVEQSQISVVFVDPRAMQRINREYLGHDYVTDVVTFPLGDGLTPLSGELIVCPSFAAEWAQEAGWPVHVETALYVVHGLLHLCGYDDKKAAAAAKMRRRQKTLLERFLKSSDGPTAPKRRRSATSSR
jgi:probable rRNA maturation factor